jgi:putative component of toxin-antitoxin plasmid stabilization module
MKLHRHREHHYLKKLQRLQAAGGLPVGVGVHQLDIAHDPWCRLYKGQRCNGAIRICPGTRSGRQASGLRSPVDERPGPSWREHLPLTEE